MRPERIVHIGLGAFFRAHQAWYTAKASDSADWGIVAYTGRSAKQAEELNSQNCKYTLITRFEDHDEFELIDSLVRAESAENLADFKKTIADPQIAIVTMTITEAGYQVANLPLEQSALGRLALALEERRIAGSGPLALVSCDNMPDNAGALRAALRSLGQSLGSEFLSYLDSLSFVSTSIDRITPKTTQAEIDLVLEQTGFADQSPVVTEPFASWVLAGDFPAGRPNWESAGAQFVADIEPYENRKLWLLNGAHTLMSSLGRLLGHQNVDQAMADSQVADAVATFWDEAAQLLPSEKMAISQYRAALKDRFLNPRIGYQLSQIGQESLTKLQVRIAPVAERLIAQGRDCPGALAAIASYVALILSGVQNQDSRQGEIDSALAGEDPARALVALISPAVANNQAAISQIKQLAAGFVGVRS